MTETETLRVFLAVPADPAWVERARELVSGLRRQLPDASWTRPESWHITLHFLGEIPRQQAGRFAAEIASIVEATSGGGLETAGAVVFPSRGPARVLGAGFQQTNTAASLARLAAEAARLSSEIQNPNSKIQNRFRPHVCFARIRRPWPREAVERYRAQLSAWRPPEWRAGSCVLFQSRLDPAGAVHTPLAAWSLAAAPVEAPR